MTRSKTWQTFLRVQPLGTSNTPPAADAGMLEGRGVSSIAPTVIELLRTRVLPTVRHLQHRKGLEGFHFLIHDYQSGVPTSSSDKAEYVHLCLTFKREIELAFAEPWEMTRPIEFGSNVGGWDTGLAQTSVLRQLLDAQSAWVLDFLEAQHPSADVLRVIQQARQFLHYFSNMLQMKVQ